MNIIKKIRKKLGWSTSVLPKKYRLGHYTINLPPNHVLDKYQQSFPLYDQFLPILCAGFEGLIVDIGANIGDSTIAIFSKNEKSFIVGVEPDILFYQECLDNIFTNGLTKRFLGVNKFVSTNQGSFSIEKSNSMSTGSISSNTNEFAEQNTISFAQLMSLIPKEKMSSFDIVKIDTDGFDWDIINSFTQYVDNYRPKPRFVFFEMQTYLNNNGVNDVNREEITAKYNLSIERLQNIGYNNFCLLDNFGTPIKITQSINEIFELNDYIKRSQVYNSHSTLYYMDVLCFGNHELEYVKGALYNLYKNKTEK